MINYLSRINQKVEDLVEWDWEDGIDAHYFHSPFCEGACDYDCMGDIGFRLADHYNELKKIDAENEAHRTE